MITRDGNPGRMRDPDDWQNHPFWGETGIFSLKFGHDWNGDHVRCPNHWPGGRRSHQFSRIEGRRNGDPDGICFGFGSERIMQSV